MRFEGEVAIVTGPGQGIGRGIVLKLAREGAKMAISDINLESANIVVGEIYESSHSRCEYYIQHMEN